MILLAFTMAQAAAIAPVQATADAPAQQKFEVASAALEKGDFAAALAGFEALEPGLSRQPKALLVARARKGRALAGLGRAEEAEALLRSALQELPAGESNYRGDRYASAFTLAMIEEVDLDYAAARSDFAQAAELAGEPTEKMSALIGQARTVMFDDPFRAVALIVQASAAGTAIPALSDGLKGQLRVLRGRALLNAGDLEGAKVELAAAVKLFGGMTTKVDRRDVSARADLAITSLLSGDRATAKKYLAYSGAGTQDEAFRLGANMTPPACGGGGLRPEDVAVIEFGVADDGTVQHPVPVYSSAHDDKALIFARTVAGWSWRPEDAVKIPAFFRAQTRLELRCTTTVARSILADIGWSALDSWLRARNVPVWEASGSAAALVPQMRAELTRRIATGNRIMMLPLLKGLATNPAIGWEESQTLIKQASDIADEENAPLLVRAVFASSWAGPRRQRSSRLERLAELKRRPDFAADARTSAFLTLQMADLLIGKRNAEALPPLVVVADDKRIEAADPLKVGALTRIASIKAGEGDLSGARSAFLKTGLDAQQCALVDVSPVRVKGGASSGDVPVDAITWAISGWAQTEFDIRADGTTTNIRTVVAYPPFVYGEPMERVAARSRYTQSFRPDGGLGGGGYRTYQGFRIMT
jgi:hypothetical protein